MSRTLAVIFSFLLSASAGYAQQQQLMIPIPPSNDFQPEILNGKAAVAKEWRATLQFESNGGLCTSTIVGDKVILTAAHCVSNQAQATVLFNNKVTSITCTHHPQYKGNSCLTAATVAQIAGCTADVALCAADTAFPAELDSGEKVKFETVNANASAVKKDDKVILLGFGCTQAGGSVSPILRIGTAAVSAVPVPGASSVPNNTMQEYLTVQGGSAVCQGDSGGSAFNSESMTNRKIVGVNSRGNISTVSFLTSVSDTNIQDFLKAWSTQRNVEICGVTAGAKNCR